MKIGLYFGTFNPIHVGHLIIANHMAENSDLDQVWLVVTPHNPLKKKSSLLDDSHRLQMVHLATDDYPKLKPGRRQFEILVQMEKLRGDFAKSYNLRLSPHFI